MTITPEQCRAARGLISWSQADLARAAGLARITVARFERNPLDTQEDAIEALQTALETAGIEFVERDDGALGVFLCG